MTMTMTMTTVCRSVGGLHVGNGGLYTGPTVEAGLGEASMSATVASIRDRALTLKGEAGLAYGGRHQLWVRCVGAALRSPMVRAR